MVSPEGKRLIQNFIHDGRQETTLPRRDLLSIHAYGWGSWNSKYDDFMGGLQSASEIVPNEAPKNFREFLKGYSYHISLKRAILQVMGVSTMDGARDDDWARVMKLQTQLSKKFIQELSGEEKDEITLLYQKFRQFVNSRATKKKG